MKLQRHILVESRSCFWLAYWNMTSWSTDFPCSGYSEFLSISSDDETYMNFLVLVITRQTCQQLKLHAISSQYACIFHKVFAIWSTALEFLLWVLHHNWSTSLYPLTSLIGYHVTLVTLSQPKGNNCFFYPYTLNSSLLKNLTTEQKWLFHYYSF